MKRAALFVVVFLYGISQAPVWAHAQSAPSYISPLPGAILVSPDTTIALRFPGVVDSGSIGNALFSVEGSLSGNHAGVTTLADDRRTLIFRPERPFALGEDVSVTLRSGLRAESGQSLESQPWTFHTRSRVVSTGPDLFPEAAVQAPPSDNRNAQSPASGPAVSGDLTLPTDFPTYTVDIPANAAGDGFVFLAATAFQNPTVHTYLLILDNAGQPVYYKPISAGAYAVDFKPQPNGLLTYFDSSSGDFLALDNSYNFVKHFHAGNGYETDLHDLQVLPNGHALLMVYDREPVDLSQFGGQQNATVIGLIVQEVDAAQNVVFEWRSWDHFQITDSTEPITGAVVDYAHGNALAQDNDGNILLSSRHMDEVTKINRETGGIIWRLGGKNNQFTFVNGAPMFVHQHDIRRLANGDITLFDNRNGLDPAYSRGVEYQLDETGMKATQVWEYRNAPDTYSVAMGNVQRLANGNSVLGWGLKSAPTLTEVRPDNSKAFQLSFQSPLISYRAFRFAWQGFPQTMPTLVASTRGVTTTLAYSWNGASEVESYHVYADDRYLPQQLIATVPKTAFEDHTDLLNAPAQYCAARVVPVDKQGRETRTSNIVYLNPNGCRGSLLFFPITLP